MTIVTDNEVERVARALWELEFGTEGQWPVNVDNPEDWYAQARAALEASDRDVLVATLREAKLHLEYLSSRFQIGTTLAIITRIDAALTPLGGEGR